LTAAAAGVLRRRPNASRKRMTVTAAALASCCGNAMHMQGPRQAAEGPTATLLLLLMRKMVRQQRKAKAQREQAREAVRLLGVRVRPRRQQTDQGRSGCWGLGCLLRRQGRLSLRMRMRKLLLLLLLLWLLLLLLRLLAQARGPEGLQAWAPPWGARPGVSSSH
jgi:hypothetical protein